MADKHSEPRSRQAHPGVAILWLVGTLAFAGVAIVAVSLFRSSGDMDRAPTGALAAIPSETAKVPQAEPDKPDSENAIDAHLVNQTDLPAGDSQGSSPSKVVTPRVEFNGGGHIRFKQTPGLLVLEASDGWVWGFFSDTIDINRFSRLSLDVATTSPCEVYLELKDRTGGVERPLVGDAPNNNVWKIQLRLPNTRGGRQTQHLDLAPYFRPDPTNRLAKVIALSDPTGHMEIRNIRFRQVE
jgi:hypothetical protein